MTNIDSDGRVPDGWIRQGDGTIVRGAHDSYDERATGIPKGYVLFPDGRMQPGPGLLRTEEGRQKFIKLLEESGHTDEDSPLRFSVDTNS